jgi:nitrogen fixation protein FixH
MNELVLTLVVGVSIIVLLNLGLIHFGRMSAQQAAGAVALATLGLYVPYSILRWPGGDVFAIHLALYLLTALACGILLRARAAGDSLHWGPAAISGFFIGLTVLLATFVVIAERGLGPMLERWLLPETARNRPLTSVFPGVVSHDFQKKEALYNDYLQQVERQRQRGWQVQKGWLHEPAVNEPVVFRVAVQTRDGVPLTGANVAGQFLRSSDNRSDVAFSLAERAPGVYETELKLPRAGVWNLVLRIRKDEDWHEIRASTRIAAER